MGEELNPVNPKNLNLTKEQKEALIAEFGGEGMPEVTGPGGSKPLKQFDAEDFIDEVGPVNPGAGGLAAKALQGLSLGSADEIITAMSLAPEALAAAGDFVAGKPNSLQDLKHRYNANHKDYKDYINSVNNQYPYLSPTVEMVGSAATFIAAGPLGIGSEVALGGFAGLANSERITLGDSLKDIGLGGAMGAGGALAGKAVGAIPKKIKSLNTGTIKEAIGLTKPSQTKALANHVSKSGRTADDFAWGLMNEKVMTVNKRGRSVQKPLFEIGQTVAETKDKVVQKMSTYGHEIGQALSKADEELMAAGGGFDRNSLYMRLMDEYVNPLLSTGEADDVITAKQLEDWLNKSFLQQGKQVTTGGIDPNTGKEIVNTTINYVEATEPVSLAFLHKFKTRVANQLKNKQGYVKDAKTGSVDAEKWKVVGNLSETIDDAIESSHLSEEVYASYQHAKIRYGDLDQAAKSLEDVVQKMDYGIMGELRESLKSRGLLMGLTSRLAGASAAASTAVALGVNQFLSSKAAPATFAAGLRKLTSALAKDPEKYSAIAEKVFAAAAVSSPMLSQVLAESDAKISLMSQPLSRNTEDVLKRSESVSTFIQANHPNLHRNFVKAVRERNVSNIAEIMSTIADLQSQKGQYIESGLGWDGIAHTDEDKEAVNSWIHKIGDIRKRRDTLSSFGNTGKIPKEMLEGKDGNIAPSMKAVYKSVKEKKGSKLQKNY